jgi:hypothetical protein
MSDLPSIILTAVIALTTIVYTFYSIQLWKTTRQSAEIARQAALGNLWTELNRYVEICTQEGRPEAPFLRDFSSILAEFMIANLLKDLKAKDDPNMKEFSRKIEEMIATHDFDASTISWFAPLNERPRRKRTGY